MSKNHPNIILNVRDITVQFGEVVVLENLDLAVHEGEILGFVGPSGSGKSVLMRTVLGLKAKAQGTIEVFGQDISSLTDEETRDIDMRIGVLFQHGALFSSLTVLENIMLPMREFLDLSPQLMAEMARVKIDLVGLAPEAAEKYPSELSGGMIKRAALARSLALEPDLIFLDEPTSGLDPIGAAEFDHLIDDLRKTLGLTVYMVTHDLDSLFSVCDRIAVLGDRKVKAVGTIEEMVQSDDAWMKRYFRGERARSIIRS